MYWKVPSKRVTFAFNAVGTYLYKRVKLYQTKTTVDKTMKSLSQKFKRTLARYLDTSKGFEPMGS